MHISELDSLRNNPMIRFKNEEVDGEQYTIVHYMIANSELWTNPVALEARGNVYNSNGDCVCACFPKFFNLNERPENQENLIKDNIVLFEEKKDGSLVTPILTPKGNIVFKTKKSFYSDVALLANQCVTEDILKLSRIYLEELLTPLFEFTHPETQIVINYGPKPQFTLLAVRDMINGQEIPYEYLKEDLAQLNSSIPLINTYSFYTWDQFRNTLETTKGIEGFVLILDDGRRVKVKTEEYLRLHRVYTELRQRDVAEACVDETLDDILGKKRINFVQHHDGKNKRNAKPCCITFFTIVYNISVKRKYRL